MDLLLNSSLLPMKRENRFTSAPLIPPSSFNTSNHKKQRKFAATVARVQAFFDPFGDQPILKDALKEPVAFMGGVFAGLLRLDLDEEPLKDWISMTVEASGIAAEWEISAGGIEVEAAAAPQQIEIE